MRRRPDHGALRCVSARKSRRAAPCPVACGARRMDLTVLTRTRSSASSRRVAIRPAPVAESSTSCGIMAQPWASSSPREGPEDSPGRGPLGRCPRWSGRRSHRSGEESCVTTAGPKHLSSLRFRRSSRPPRRPIQHLLTNSVAGPRPRFVLRLCIRKAGEARGEAALGDGPADTRFFNPRRHPGTPVKWLVCQARGPLVHRLQASYA